MNAWPQMQIFWDEITGEQQMSQNSQNAITDAAFNSTASWSLLRPFENQDI